MTFATVPITPSSPTTPPMRKSTSIWKSQLTSNTRNLFSEHYLTCSWMNHGNTWLEHIRGWKKKGPLHVVMLVGLNNVSWSSRWDSSSPSSSRSSQQNRTENLFR
jgi:hypothetical protein